MGRMVSRKERRERKEGMMNHKAHEGHEEGLTYHPAPKGHPSSGGEFQRPREYGRTRNKILETEKGRVK